MSPSQRKKAKLCNASDADAAEESTAAVTARPSTSAKTPSLREPSKAPLQIQRQAESRAIDDILAWLKKVEPAIYAEYVKNDRGSKQYKTANAMAKVIGDYMDEKKALKRKLEGVIAESGLTVPAAPASGSKEGEAGKE